MDYAEEAEKARLETAWLIAAYQRIDKLPRSPSDLFKKESSEGGGNVDQILNVAKQMKAAQDAESRRSKPETFMREI